MPPIRAKRAALGLDWPFPAALSDITAEESGRKVRSAKGVSFASHFRCRLGSKPEPERVRLPALPPPGGRAHFNVRSTCRVLPSVASVVPWMEPTTSPKIFDLLTQI